MTDPSTHTDRKRITLGYSPCPNDTFIFHGIASGALRLPGYDMVEQLHDVETLNAMAMEKRLDVTKLSFHAWLRLKDNYRLLQSGAALGFGCGPILIARRPLARSDIDTCRVVLPGQWTTAHLLFRLWAPKAEDKYFAPYDRIFTEIESGRADCGVIIHENRFTFEAAGFQAVVDLGAWWEHETGMPIPLGCIAAKAEMGENAISAVESLIGDSIRMAKEDPESTLHYMRRYAQEMEIDVLHKHVRTFVNEFSLDLGVKGRAAVAELERRDRDAGVIQ